MKKGIAASKGYAIGKVFLYEEQEVIITNDLVNDTSVEMEKLTHAIKLTKKQLEQIKEKAKASLGEDEAAVFEAHLLILEDPEYIDSIQNEIKDNKANSLHAIESVTKGLVALFEAIDDPYLRERAADIKDVSRRLLANLAGHTIGLEINEPETIVIAHDLTPSDTAQLDKEKVVGFLTNIGGRTSHSAIMARTLEIPAVVGLKDITSCVQNGDTVIIDGTEGLVIINPDEATIRTYRDKQIAFKENQKQLKKLKDVQVVTKEGKKIEVCGNIGKPEDVLQVLEYGGDGIGLFRTEFLYMDREQAPTEEEQFESYKFVLEKMEGKKVVIRTLDIGGDKTLPYLPLPIEMNPFLGYRAIRLCLDQIEIFKVQIRALLRASVYGQLAVMFPMISGIEEFKQAMEIVELCKKELEKEGRSYSEAVEWGIMIEIPAAAVMADELAKHVDFFSIGTNDLIQYTLAADRMSEKVSYLYNPLHPAVLRLIKMTIDGAHSQGKWVGMCGEMAGDEEAIPTLLEYGLDEFSMSATSILGAKKKLLEN
ncbi:phosphoenolpyruvate--protein phosphotransferase [Sporanaerobium hydrogeniformans]|uniref:Phosphoenolpyruvate--protein phosphotransferase n=1 Tax=Sporanaerobium hydrogeniformans TaxID=3072179 RepID=A0AC61DAE2_9FIRM|nr:phosphoenolpyruvate--protein phosphotransferase [Sporanaerobium hydrogeniformans]PHV69497.1 phosphoenolpyruvate--protein phosphotransferase [Sporanaerobium hydrogeniformans]